MEILYKKEDNMKMKERKNRKIERVEEEDEMEKEEYK
jgi:hypothetical protein